MTKEDRGIVVKTLCSILDDDNVELWELHKTAAEALGDIVEKVGIGAKDAIPSLMKTLTRSYIPKDHEYPLSDVAETVKESLVKIAKYGARGDAPTRNSVINDLIAVLEREDSKTRNRDVIIQALGEIEATEAIAPLLKIVNDDEDYLGLRMDAIKSLTKIIEASSKGPHIASL